MRTLVAFFLILLIGFTSCEGRKTQNQALKESIDDFNKTLNFEKDIFIPENYVEREVDSILSNGFRVKIKTYSDMENHVLFTKIKDTINFQTHYRNFKFDIVVEKEGETVYNKSFDKVMANEMFGFAQKLPNDSELFQYNQLAVLKSINLNDDPSNKDFIAIDLIYAIPETDRLSYHKITINEDGRANIFLTDSN